MRFGDFMSHLAAGAAAGGVQGMKLGMAARELADKRAIDEATLAEKRAANANLASYRAGSLGIQQQNADTSRGNLSVAQGNLAVAQGNAGTLKNYRNFLIENGWADNETKVMEVAVKAGYRPGLYKRTGEPDPGPYGFLGMTPPTRGGGGGGGGGEDGAVPSLISGLGEIDVNEGADPGADPEAAGDPNDPLKKLIAGEEDHAGGGKVGTGSYSGGNTTAINRMRVGGWQPDKQYGRGQFGRDQQQLSRQQQIAAMRQRWMQAMQQHQRRQLPQQVTRPGPTGAIQPAMNTGIVPPMTQTLPARPMVAPAAIAPAAIQPNMAITKPAPMPSMAMTKPAPMQAFAEGGRVTEEDRRRKTTMQVPTPEPTVLAKSAISPLPPSPTGKDQSQASEVPQEPVVADKDTRQKAGKMIAVGLHALGKESRVTKSTQYPEPPPEAQVPDPNGAIGAPRPGPDQGGQVQRPWMGTEPMSSEEAAGVEDGIDPDHKLSAAMRQLEIMKKSFEFYEEIGDKAGMEEFAKAYLNRSRMIASTYGQAAEQALNDGDFVKAFDIASKGWNDNVPDGSTLIRDKNGLLIYRDATGKVVGKYDPTPENVSAAVAGMKDGTLWWDAMRRAAGESMTETDKTATDKDTKSGGLGDNRAVMKQLLGQKETDDGTEGPNIIRQRLASVLFDPNKLTGDQVKAAKEAKAAGKSGELPADQKPAPFQMEADESLGEAGIAASTEDAATYKKMVTPAVEQAVADVARDLAVQSDGKISLETAAQLAAQMAAVDYSEPDRAPFDIRQDKNPKTKKLDGGFSVRIGGNVYKLPQSSLPALQQVVDFQKKVGAATLAKHEEFDKADKDAAQSAATRGAWIDAGTDLVSSSDRGAKATYLGKQPAGGRPQQPGPSLGEAFLGNVGKRPKSEPGDPVPSKTARGTTSVSRTRGTSPPLRVEQRTAKASAGPTSRPRLDTRKPPVTPTTGSPHISAPNVPEYLRSLMEEPGLASSLKSRADAGARATGALLRPGDNETKQAVGQAIDEGGTAVKRAIGEFVDRVIKSFTRLKQGAVGGRSSPPTRAQVIAAARQVAGNKPVPASVIDQILQMLHDKLMTRVSG